MKVKKIIIPEYVGGYRIGGDSYYTQFNLLKKPNAIHRFFCKVLLGWEWADC